MNYNSTKQYGAMIKEMASQIAQSNNIYNVSAKLYEAYNESLYLISRLSFKELYDNYPNNQKVLSFVIDEYVIDDKVREVFLTKLFQNDDFEIEFIKRDIGGAYNFLCATQTLLQAMAITAHPIQYKEGQLTTALEQVIKPVIEPSIKNAENFGFAFNSLAAKDALKAAAEQTEQVKAEKTKEPKSKYKIENEQLLLDIYKILQEQKIISNDVSFVLINKIVASGNASIIKPLKKWAFFIALYFMKDSISNNTKEWVADITKSLGIKQNALTQNKPTYEELYELLEETVEKNLK
ncbi:MAG: hypothetical protein IKX31_08865 [Muribaculaceae bacterium]|nr:hypothetical protein [Muribaculaceae bacterium]